MTDGYYCKRHLAEFGNLGEHRPELAAKFFDYYGAVVLS